MAKGGGGSARIDVAHAVAQVDTATPQALAVALEPIAAASRALVPYDEGDLESTQQIVVGDREAGISYDSPADFKPSPRVPSLAILQHENLQIRHDGGRQAKFLEQPFNAGVDQALARLAGGLAAAFD